jgi:hypothetical protein
MSAISLYPQETIKVVNHVYSGDPGPGGQPTDPGNTNNTQTSVTTPHATIVKVIAPLPFANDGLNQTNLNTLFATMTTILTDIKQSLLSGSGSNSTITVDPQSINEALASITALQESFIQEPSEPGTTTTITTFPP